MRIRINIKKDEPVNWRKQTHEGEKPCEFKGAGNSRWVREAPLEAVWIQKKKWGSVRFFHTIVGQNDFLTKRGEGRNESGKKYTRRGDQQDGGRAHKRTLVKRKFVTFRKQPKPNLRGLRCRPEKGKKKRGRAASMSQKSVQKLELRP